MRKPQWSLTFEVRKSQVLKTDPLFVLEPQWSLTFEVRKRTFG